MVNSIHIIENHIKSADQKAEGIAEGAAAIESSLSAAGNLSEGAGIA